MDVTLKNKRGFIPMVWVLIVAGLLVIGGGAYYVVQKSNIKVQNEKQECEQRSGKSCSLFQGLCQVEMTNDPVQAAANEAYLRECEKKIGTWQPAELDTKSGLVNLFERKSSWGPCPTAGGCKETLLVYASGQFLIESETSFADYLDGSEIDQLRTLIAQSGVMSKTCNAPSVTDVWETHTINFDNKVKTITFPGCESELKPIDAFLDQVITAKRNEQQNTRSASSTAGWQTYRNEKLGFQIKYPPTFQSKKELYDREEKMFSSSPSLLRVSFSDQQTGFSVVVGKDAIDTQIKSFASGLSGAKREDIVIDGEKAVKISGDRAMDMNMTEYIKDSVYIFERSGTLFILHHFGDVLLFDEIANTFKFIGATSSWQTYRNEQYGFEFKYPSNWKIGKYNEGDPFMNQTALDPQAVSCLTIMETHPACKAQGRIVIYGTGNITSLKSNNTTTFANGLVADYSRLESGGRVPIGKVWDFFILDIPNARKAYPQWLVINVLNDKQESSENQIIGQILSTFKFTN